MDDKEQAARRAVELGDNKDLTENACVYIPALLVVIDKLRETADLEDDELEEDIALKYEMELTLKHRGFQNLQFVKLGMCEAFTSQAATDIARSQAVEYLSTRFTEDEVEKWTVRVRLAK